jgi:hypothetical protein
MCHLNDATKRFKKKPRNAGLLLFMGVGGHANAGVYIAGCGGGRFLYSARISEAVSMHEPHPEATPSSACNFHKSVAPDFAALRICLSVMALQMQTYMEINQLACELRVNRKCE